MALEFKAGWNEREVPWNCKLQNRLTIGILIIFVLVFGVSSFLMIDYEKQLVQKQRVAIANQLGDVLSNTLSAEMMKGEMWDDIEALTDKMRAASGAERIQILSREGEVLAGTDFSLESYEYSKEEDAECAACHLHGAKDFPSIVISTEGEKTVLRTITPIKKERRCNECHEDEETNFLGMISIDFDYTPIERENNEKKMRFFLLVTVIAVVMFAAIYWMLSKEVLHPIKILMEASRHLARGHYDTQLDVSGEDELSRLGETFNHVANEIKKANDVLAVESENNYQSAITDGLTGFRNKVFGHETLMELILESHKCEEPLSVLMVDLDFFKKVNDTYGHLAGDMVLRETATRIKQLLHYSDTPVRYGGEEFLIILANTDEAGLNTVGERLRAKIADSKFIIDDDGAEIEVTASLGGTVCLTNDGKSEDMIERADNALYQAKGGGRNQLVIL